MCAPHLHNSKFLIPKLKKVRWKYAYLSWAKTPFRLLTVWLSPKPNNTTWIKHGLLTALVDFVRKGVLKIILDLSEIVVTVPSTSSHEHNHYSNHKYTECLHFAYSSSVELEASEDAI